MSLTRVRKILILAIAIGAILGFVVHFVWRNWVVLPGLIRQEKTALAFEEQRFRTGLAELDLSPAKRVHAEGTADRLYAARMHLVEEHPLVKPYLVGLVLDRAGLTVDWMEDGYSVAGVMLRYRDNEGIQAMKFPVFHDAWTHKDKHEYRNTIRRDWRVFLRIGDSYDTIVPASGGTGEIKIIVVPLSFLEADIEGAVYDDKGNVSNFIPLRFFPGTKDAFLETIAP